MNSKEYEIEYFKEEGFIRKKCDKCGSHFWTRDKDRNICGDAPCEIYSFIGRPIFEERSVEEVREAFLSFFEHCSHKHTRMKRYPVVARWRDDIYLNIASIANFQPLVTSGKVAPPANPLVISQPCIRLEDLESIGKSGRHLTMFEMMGHHAFNKRGEEEIYWKNETVKYCDGFLRQLGVDMNSITYKEAPWVGGGNAGPCLEVITNGLELATLVFMDLKLSPRGDGEISLNGQRYNKMDTYIVDTGYGLERFVWASKGTPTVYDAIFPGIINELVDAAGIEHPMEKHSDTMTKIASLSGTMSSGEIAKRLNITPEFINNILKPMESIYAVADHSKCLAFMLADGIVPSNAKEGYLVRLVLRRAFRMLKALGIEMPLENIILTQIKTLRRSFPELENAVDRVVEIVSLEHRRYGETLSKGDRIVRQKAREWKQKGEQKIPLDTLINLYDTHGLPPEFVKEVATEQEAGIVQVDIPENFYSLVASMHSGAEKEKDKNGDVEPFVEEMKEKTKTIPATKKLYYEKPSAVEFEATVLDVIDDSVVLDRTLFFPEGGGQPADTGVLTLKDEGRALNVLDVQEMDGVILHKIENGGISKGAVVSGHIDVERRVAHTRHHSATHIVVCAARKVLGEHVWQAGAQKGEKRARIDITHFKRISNTERREIEMLANRMVMENKDIIARFEDRNEAERKYGFDIYQGGVPPGKKIRIVRIGADDDVQACAGTHCSKTGEVGPIKILRTERIQDGIERIEYSAGEAAVEAMQAREELIRESASVLRVPHDKLPSAVERFFDEWKQLRKENERLRSKISEQRIRLLTEHAKEISGVNVIAEVLPDADTKEMMKIASQLSKDNFLTILIGKKEKRASVVSSVPAYLKDEINASVLVKRVCEVLGGSGGGKAEIAQGGGEMVEKAEEARNEGLKFTKELLKKREKKIL
uniref:Alanine--tRNA ligase n=1 Tax=Candidatus Methanophagaceae archaeon ANME-1 ERB6 TaxID=2759912 RepID=A0A7G9YZ99_9EURY|nr:alanine--tRNA ligase [Methanosarcinales archaeon ANME-1 ERB6]